MRSALVLAVTLAASVCHGVDPSGGVRVDTLQPSGASAPAGSATPKPTLPAVVVAKGSVDQATESRRANIVSLRDLSGDSSQPRLPNAVPVTVRHLSPEEEEAANTGRVLRGGDDNEYHRVEEVEAPPKQPESAPVLAEVGAGAPAAKVDAKGTKWVDLHVLTGDKKPLKHMAPVRSVAQDEMTAVDEENRIPEIVDGGGDGESEPSSDIVQVVKKVESASLLEEDGGQTAGSSESAESAEEASPQNECNVHTTCAACTDAGSCSWCPSSSACSLVEENASCSADAFTEAGSCPTSDQMASEGQVVVEADTIAHAGEPLTASDDARLSADVRGPEGGVGSEDSSEAGGEQQQEEEEEEADAVVVEQDDASESAAAGSEELVLEESQHEPQQHATEGNGAAAGEEQLPGAGALDQAGNEAVAEVDAAIDEMKAETKQEDDAAAEVAAVDATTEQEAERTEERTEAVEADAEAVRRTAELREAEVEREVLRERVEAEQFARKVAENEATLRDLEARASSLERAFDAAGIVPPPTVQAAPEQPTPEISVVPEEEEEEASSEDTVEIAAESSSEASEASSSEETIEVVSSSEEESSEASS